MIKIKEAVIVEGKYDKIKLTSIIDSIIIETDGFGIFKDKEKQKLIRRLAENRGIVILTDSDSAGFVIRNFLTSIVPKNLIKNVYIPDIYGKEKRKTEHSKEGKLGVEGVSTEILKNAFKQAGIGFENEIVSSVKKVELIDFYNDGLSGSADSKIKRNAFIKYLDLPERLSTKGLLEIINSFLTYEEYKNAIEHCMEEK